MSLIDWIDGDDHGLINFYSHGGWEGTDFDDLAKSVCAAAELFVSAGIRRGDRVALVLPTGREFFDRFFGALAIGAIPTVLPTPGIGGQEFCDTHLAKMLRILAPRVVVSSTDVLGFLGVPIREVGALGLDVADPLRDSNFSQFAPARADETALIQFTSGSTSSPKGVMLTADAVLQYMATVKSVFHGGGRSGYNFGSWLPLHHDMGLIGMFMFSALYRTNGWFMPPEVFVRRPLVWLELFGKFGVNHSAIPNFAIERLIRVLKPENLTDFDFSEWRTLMVGSDRINFHALRKFYDMMAPYGFGPDVIKPGYGMAETTLGVTTDRPKDVMKALAIGSEGGTQGGPALIQGVRSLTDPLLVPDGPSNPLYVVCVVVRTFLE